MKNVRKITSALLALVMCMGMTCSFAYAADFASAPKDVKSHESVQKGSDITLNFTVFDSGFVLVPTQVKETSAALKSPPEISVSKSFIHNLYDRNGTYVGTITTTVNGMYSRLDNWAEITSITATFRGSHANNLSYTTSINGNTGSVYIYYNGVAVASVIYNILTNGTIQQA